MLSFGGGEAQLGVASINKDIKDRENGAGLDNLSEVSEESAFEEEDEDYFAADLNRNNPKENITTANMIEKLGKTE